MSNHHRVRPLKLAGMANQPHVRACLTWSRNFKACLVILMKAFHPTFRCHCDDSALVIKDIWRPSILYVSPLHPNFAISTVLLSFCFPVLVFLDASRCDRSLYISIDSDVTPLYRGWQSYLSNCSSHHLPFCAMSGRLNNRVSN